MTVWSLFIILGHWLAEPVVIAVALCHFSGNFEAKKNNMCVYGHMLEKIGSVENNFFF